MVLLTALSRCASLRDAVQSRAMLHFVGCKRAVVVIKDHSAEHQPLFEDLSVIEIEHPLFELAHGVRPLRHQRKVPARQFVHRQFDVLCGQHVLPSRCLGRVLCLGELGYSRLERSLPARASRFGISENASRALGSLFLSALARGVAGAARAQTQRAEQPFEQPFEARCSVLAILGVLFFGTAEDYEQTKEYQEAGKNQEH